MQKHPWWTFGGNDPWITTTNKRSNGKRSVFLAVSLANHSDWICTEKARIHRCNLHEIWMEGERPTHSLCLWWDKFCGSQPHRLCKLGDYTSMRHNSVRDSEAQIMREVCRDVQTEPTLLPINENGYQRKVNTADNARLDISARGLWNSCEKTFFDIRITQPTSQLYSGKSLAEAYQQYEKEKDKYSITKEWLT